MEPGVSSSLLVLTSAFKHYVSSFMSYTKSSSFPFWRRPSKMILAPEERQQCQFLYGNKNVCLEPIFLDCKNPTRDDGTDHSPETTFGKVAATSSLPPATASPIVVPIKRSGILHRAVELGCLRQHFDLCSHQPPASPASLWHLSFVGMH